MLLCPKCTNNPLIPVDGSGKLLGSGPWPKRCSHCGGIWVPQGAVAPLMDSEVEFDTPASNPDSQNDSRTGMCPEGHGILRRARIQWRDSFFLERCTDCGGIWFDAGEWNRIASDHVLHDITQLWSSSWRSKMTDERTSMAVEEDLREKLGEDLYEELAHLGEQLRGHENVAEALAHLAQLVRQS